VFLLLIFWQFGWFVKVLVIHGDDRGGGVGIFLGLVVEVLEVIFIQRILKESGI